MPAERVAALPTDELMDRIDAATKPDGTLDIALADGILGLAEKPKFTLSKLLDTYWTISADKVAGKSKDQIRRNRNPRLKAFRNLIAVIGDQPVDQISADDLLDFRSWWWDKITDEDLTPNSANKDFTHIASTIREVNQKKRLGLTLDLARLNFSEGAKRTRVPFSEGWIKSTILKRDALNGLNTEARCLLLGMINTGYRPSEGQGLLRDQIRLDTDIPHISIEPVGRTLKNASSQRIIPLTGISLEAFQACPDGFPRYRGKAGLSATINKFLRENKLTETPAHTLYGLRHSFEDRLLDRDVDERIRRDLMGHSLTRERYGRGASLEKLAGIVQSIAL
jgi:integrase